MLFVIGDRSQKKQLLVTSPGRGCNEDLKSHSEKGLGLPGHLALVSPSNSPGTDQSGRDTLGDDSSPVPAGVGTQITAVPYTITAPGFYYLGGNLSGRIYVHSSNVTLDLMGFTISGSGVGSGTGISISGTTSGLENVEIRNGTIRNFV